MGIKRLRPNAWLAAAALIAYGVAGGILPAMAAEHVLRVGAAAIDVTPTTFPVIVNGMFEERQADRAVDPLMAKAFVLDDGDTRLAIAVVDSLMLPRELLDEAKRQAAALTGIQVDRMLISATHTHSAASSMGCLGSRVDPHYPALVVPQIARAIQIANDRLQPAQVGWAKVRAPGHTFCRRYIRRPDRMMDDPFGQKTVRAHMHPGYLSPDVLGPSGPTDDELTVVAMKDLQGRPLAVLANFSMHYVGSPMVSADYFGRFAAHLARRIDGGDGADACIVAMSQGTSGDLMGMNYSAPAVELDYDRFADELADLAANAYRNAPCRTDVDLAMCQSTLLLKRRTPNADRLAWAKEIVAAMGDSQPRGYAEVYAREQVLLAAEPQRELILQAIRIGDLAIAAIPNEVFGITGLKLKLQSPLPASFNMELANGAEGYIPPPEQHALGGYTTWPARTAGLEVEAEPKIVEALLKLHEQAAGRPRRPLAAADCAYAEAVRKSKPRGYWRLADIAGDQAAAAVASGASARYEGGVALYLPGPPGTGLAAQDQANRAPQFAGGRLHVTAANVGPAYSVEFWFYNALPVDAREVTGYLFTRGPTDGSQSKADRLAISGASSSPGQLAFSTGPGEVLAGKSQLEPYRWHHVVVVRDSRQVRVYLDGRTEPEIAGEAAALDATSAGEWNFAGDERFSLEGKLDEPAIYDRALTADEAARHFAAAAVESNSP